MTSKDVVEPESAANIVENRQSNKLVIPRRAQSILEETKPMLVTADKLDAEDTLLPKEEPYQKPKKLRECQTSPLTLYELAAFVVDRLPFPAVFSWSDEDVADWMANEVGLPQYRECILNNYINGRRLLMLEDPSHLAAINIRNFDHIKTITAKVHELLGTEYIKFNRSIGLPPRKPLTHCTWFKSRTGPSWGIRQNWTRYQKPDFPKVLFGRIPKRHTHEHIPHYKPTRDICREYLSPRKFQLLTGVRESRNFIWMEHLPAKKERKAAKESKTFPRSSTLMPKEICLNGLKGKDLMLARRKMPKRKFLA